MTSSPMVLMTVPWFWSVAARIHVNADAHHVPGSQIAQQLIELGTADNVGKYDRNFDFCSHGLCQIILIPGPGR